MSLSREEERHRRHSEGEYYSIKDEFLQNSPEHLLYTAIYQVKKDLRRRFPDSNPYSIRNYDDEYILLTALSNLAFLLALQDIENPFRSILEELEDSEANSANSKLTGPDLIDPELEQRISDIVQETMRKTMAYRRIREEELS